MRSLLFLLLYVFTASCGYGSFSESIIGDYDVNWIERREQQAICRATSSTGCEVMVPEYVFAVGHNDNFIIAKQHPTAGFAGDFKINTAVTNYYIIDFGPEDDAVHGPLSKAVFDAAREKLGIENIEFDMVYPDVP